MWSWDICSHEETSAAYQYGSEALGSRWNGYDGIVYRVHDRRGGCFDGGREEYARCAKVSLLLSSTRHQGEGICIPSSPFALLPRSHVWSGQR
jgi:hypothetical protein